MRRLAIWACILSLVGAGCPLASTPAAPASTSPQAAANSNAAVLNEVWQTVRDHFYDPSLHGLDWVSIRTR
jgi:Tricorn protease C1 domain